MEKKIRRINVGIIGFGTVGAGVVECIQRNGGLIAERTGIMPVLSGIADLDITSDRGVIVPPGLLTKDATGIIESENTDVIVELVGGTGIAKDFILRALSLGKPVVTANKALLATHGGEIFAAAEKSVADVYYEASVGGGIPIIKTMREGLAGNNILELVGILNGTCNYILTRMEQEGASFAEILAAAQAAGYAEADPTFDIDGIDTAHKATIMASLAYGEWFGTKPLYIEGIRGVALQDLRYAAELGYRIKLLAIVKQEQGSVQMRVHPTLIPAASLLGNVNGVFNAVCVRGDTVGDIMCYGRGAGREATASAVVADIVDVGLNLKFGSHRRVPAFNAHKAYSNILPMADVITRYYLRLQVEDRPGVLARIAGLLAQKDISIASVSQEEHPQSGFGTVPLIILTHKAREADMSAALNEIKALPELKEAPVILRIEDLA